MISRSSFAVMGDITIKAILFVWTWFLSVTHIYLLHNILPQPWEVELLGFKVVKLRDVEFYSLEDHEDRPPNIEIARNSLALYHDRNLGLAVETLREMILFSLGICSSDGIPSVPLYLETTERAINKQLSFESIISPKKLNLYRGMNAEFFVKILVCLRDAYKRTPDRLEIAIRRYNNFLSNGGSPEGLLDLSICLESLFRAGTEISFRFSLGLVKLIGYKENLAKQYFELFRKLYDLRSKYVHGDPSYKKTHKLIAPHLRLLRGASSKALGLYVLYLKENGPGNWDGFLQDRMITK